jgi:hypothetical protein
MTTDEALNKVRSVYLELAGRPVSRACTRRAECCQFILTGKVPYLTRGEALLAAKAFRATGRTRLQTPPDGACPLLDPDTQRCLIYEDRPFACRTHYCRAAGGPYARAEVLDLIRALENVDRQLGSEGARPLEPAVKAALQDLGARRSGNVRRA